MSALTVVPPALGDLDTTDLFCGAGGSGLGAAAAGVQLVMAANHSTIAITTHEANFPDTAHDCADISQVNPRRYRRTRILWASPECTNHSGAKGTPFQAQLDLFSAPDPVVERSRATMWDVPRFAEWHRYDVVIVENVVQVARWEMWPAWLYAMKCLGYFHQVVSLNSMHAAGEVAPRAPQSRDRVYIVFTRTGIPTPDLEPRPVGWCAGCEEQVATVQWWKTETKIGKYRQQYLYRCPGCHRVVEPDVVAAAEVIDWSLPGSRIGDRDRPLRPKTLDRIRDGLERYAHTGLVVPVEGRDGIRARHVGEPLRALTTRAETALVVPYSRTGVARLAGSPLPTLTTHDRAGVAFIAELRGGGSKHRAVTEPLATLTASGRHHMLVRNDRAVPVVEDCTFRMLQIPEIQAGMAFTPTYVIKGNKREQTAQLGNAVTPPASEWLYRQCAKALGVAA